MVKARAIIAAFATAAAIVASGAIGGGVASAGTHPMPATHVAPNSNTELGDFKGIAPNKCMFIADSGVGDVISENCAFETNEYFGLPVNTGACVNGHVTSSCPFNFGVGNSVFRGDAIVTIKSQSHTNDCAHVVTTATLVMGACNATGTNYVRDGFSLINVNCANGAGTYINCYVTGQAAGFVFETNSFNEGYSQIAVEN